ncbi:MAG TPA: hypothetical protein VFP87_11675, partial [Chitinophagaceae bacterium]|nr:hypothetical protein [Chitinophagaceae bacterium]
YNFNSLGHLSFMIFDNMHRLTVKGQYSESIALLSEYVATRKLNGKGEIKVRKFYQPLRDGLWYYYDESGKAYLKQKYLKGILIEEYSSKND